jgi:hypothetical protein
MYWIGWMIDVAGWILFLQTDSLTGYAAASGLALLALGIALALKAQAADANGDGHVSGEEAIEWLGRQQQARSLVSSALFTLVFIGGATAIKWYKSQDVVVSTAPVAAAPASVPPPAPAPAAPQEPRLRETVPAVLRGEYVPAGVKICKKGASLTMTTTKIVVDGCGAADGVFEIGGSDVDEPFVTLAVADHSSWTVKSLPTALSVVTPAALKGTWTRR